MPILIPRANLLVSGSFIKFCNGYLLFGSLNPIGPAPLEEGAPESYVWDSYGELVAGPADFSSVNDDGTLLP